MNAHKHEYEQKNEILGERGKRKKDFLSLLFFTHFNIVVVIC